ncbi:MAG: hypothetical protein K6T35_05480, partial [Meiothermus silvanus]|nr:hypothetical protein [Allomeiothermus silvanus]
ALTWRLEPLSLTLEGGYYLGSNVELRSFTPTDTPGAMGGLGWIGLRVGWPEGEISYASDSAGGVRFGLRYGLRF